MITKFGLKYSIGAILKRGPIALKKKIHDVLIGVTYKCQCQCEHCAMAGYKKEGEELSTDEIKNVVNQLFNMNVRIVKFFGGEPLLRPDIYELIKYTSPKMLPNIATNGLLLSKENVNKLKDSGLHILQVSVDSANAEQHNSQRKIKCFDRAVEGLKLAKEIGIPHRIMSSHVKKEDLLNGNIEKLIQFGKELGVNNIKLINSVNAGKLIAHNKGVTAQEYKKILEVTKDPLVSLESFTCLSHKKQGFYVSPYGDIQPCAFIPIPFGNIREKPVEEIVKNMWNHKMFNVQLNSHECLMNNNDFREKNINQ